MSLNIEDMVYLLRKAMAVRNAMDICILEDGLQYKCAFVQHVMDDGLKITRITLERLKEDYGIL